ncbi:MAG: enoyl-CoA hydratase-related protein [Pseudomonadota bacterium]|nr:enoyl-CoA hydratase-related protein [Pseudomonadota bacterium]
MWRDLQAFATEVASRTDIHVVIVQGDGNLAFSAGADISGFDSGRAGVSQAKVYDDGVEETCRAFEAIPQPTIALIRGPCIGAGASLAASCDLRVAADDAFFAVPAARLGLGYDPRGVQRFVRVFGAGSTQLLLYRAGRLAAIRAHALGVVHLLAPAVELDAVVALLAQEIAANAPLTLKAAKVAIRAAMLSGVGADVLTAQAHALAVAADASADYLEGRRAFDEKRPPRFTGR